MTQESASTPQPESSKTLPESRFPGLTLERWRRPRISEAEALQAAEHLREDLSCVPFYAKRAAEEKARSGDEMAYWLDLQGSEATLRRR
jgi:hypothetical protein